MTSGQKTAFSLLATMVIYAAFVLVANTKLNLFEKLEKQYYSQAKVREKVEQLDEISKSYDSYITNVLNIIDKSDRAYLKSEAVISYLDYYPSEKLIEERRNKTTQLFNDIPGLSGLRIVDKDGRYIQYSSFEQTDITNKDSNKKVYDRYNSVVEKFGEIPFEVIGPNVTSPARKISFDAAKQRIIISFPIYRYEIYSGVLFAYFDFNEIQKRLDDTEDFVHGATPFLLGDATYTGGLVIGVPPKDLKSFVEPVMNYWKGRKLDSEIKANLPEKILQLNDGRYYEILTSPKSEYITVSGVYTNDIFEISTEIKWLIYIAIGISLFLIIFLIFSFKGDSVVTLKKRIRRIQYGVIHEYLNNKEEVEWEKVVSQIKVNKDSLSKEILKAAHVSKRKAKELDEVLAKSWDEIFAVIEPKVEEKKAEIQNNSGVSKEELRQMLEEVLKETKLNVNVANVSAVADAAAPSQVKKTVKKPKVTKPVVEEELEEIEEIDEIAADDVEDVEAIDEIEEIEEIAEVDELDEVEEIEEVEEAEPADELDEVEKIEEVEEAEPAEELDEVEEIEEVEEAESAEELDEVEEIEEVEEAEPADELDEVEEIEEVEEAEPAEELDEVEEIEEVEEAEPAEELDEVEEIEEVEEAEPAEELDEVEEIEEVEEAEPADELDEVEEIEEVEEAESAEELDEVEEIEEVEEAESAEELDEVESAETEEDLEEIQEAGEITADDVEDAESIDDLEDIPEIADVVEELNEVEEIEEVEEAEPAEELDEVEEIEEVEEAEVAEDLEDADDVEEIEEVEDLEDLEDLSEAEPEQDAEQALKMVKALSGNIQYEYKDSDDTYLMFDDKYEFANVENLFAEEICLGEDYKIPNHNDSVLNIKVFEYAKEDKSENEYKVNEESSDKNKIDQIEEAAEEEPVEITEEQIASLTEDNDALLEDAEELEPISDEEMFISDNYFTMTKFGANTNSIVDLEGVSSNSIVENEGVYSIADNLKYTDVIQDPVFKELVDSVLK